MIKTVADLAVDMAYEFGAKAIFYVPGGAAMYLNNALFEHRHLKAVSFHHEGAAAWAAESAAQLTGLGVAMVTSGPGLTNAISGIASAWVNSHPLIVLAGQVKSSDLKQNNQQRQRGLQEIDTVSLTSAITKRSIEIHTTVDARNTFESCYALAKDGRRGPVVISIPLDIQRMNLDGI